MIARIDLVPGGYFAAQASTISVSDEEIKSLERNEGEPMRVYVIGERLKHAAANLYHAIPMGSC